MTDAEIDEKQKIPESNMERGTTPTCWTVETKEEVHGSILVEEQQNTDSYLEQPKRNQKAKGKLIRSAAVCEDAPPAEPSNKESGGTTELTSSNTSMPTCEEESHTKHKECRSGKKPSLSKEPSLEYTDSTGIDLEEFLITTLNSSHRDRLMLLKLEQDMTDFMTDNCSYKKFPHMSSYHRMLVHRVAAYFGLEHNVDHSGKAIIINKTSNSRIPEQRFAEHVQEERSEDRRVILKRDNSHENEDSQVRMPRVKEQTKSKSFEEREEEYQRVRERIFSQESSFPAQTAQCVYIETRGPEDCCNVQSETQRRRQLFKGTRNGSGQQSGSRQSSFELECHWGDPRPWSSTDSDSSTWGSKPTLSHSDSNPKLFKTVTEASATNSPSYVLVPAESNILPGSILVNPHTGQPYLNLDGTPAVYNPPGNQQSVSQLNTMQTQVLPPPLQHSLPSNPVPQVQYPMVAYHSQQVLPVSSSQIHPPEHGRDDFSSQFSHMSMNHQYSGDTSDLPTYCHHGVLPTQSYTQLQHSYTPAFTEDSYMCSGMTPIVSTAPPPQTCSQQSSQVSVYSFPGQCGNTVQQYGPASYSTQTGYSTVLTNQQQAYPSMVGTQVLPSTQKCITGSYPSTSSYPMAPPLQPYSSTGMVSRQTGPNVSAVPSTGLSVYCNPVPASPPISVGVTCQSGNCRNTCNRSHNHCWY